MTFYQLLRCGDESFPLVWSRACASVCVRPTSVNANRRQVKAKIEAFRRASSQLAAATASGGHGASQEATKSCRAPRHRRRRHSRPSPHRASPTPPTIVASLPVPFETYLIRSNFFGNNAAFAAITILYTISLI